MDAHTGERTFIGITHAMTWGRTLRPPLERAASETGQVEGANEEDLAEGAEEEDGDKAGAWDKVREMGGVDRRKSEGKEKDKAKDKEHDKGDKGKGKGKDKEKEEEDGKGGDAAHGEREMERRSSHRQSATSGIESPSAGAKLRRRETSKGALLTIAEAAEVEDQADQDAVLTEGMETGRVPLVQGVFASP